jgi:rod shape-determining protein MreD
VRVAAAAAAIVLALLLQTTVAFSLIGHRAVFDLVLVAVVYIGVVAGPVPGLLAGTAAGLAQDALAGGIVGVGGLAKSVAGFLSGIAATQFIVTGAGHRFVVFFLASLLNAGILVGFNQLIYPRGFGAPWSLVLTQAALNAVIGVLAFRTVERAPEWWHGRRLRRSALRSRGRI